MDGLASGWMQIAWDQCWQVTLLAFGVWLALRIAGKNRPHLACALWLVVLVKCVTPPVVSSPSGIFCWLQPAASREGAAPAARTVDRTLPAASGGDEVVVHMARARVSDLAPRPQRLDAPYSLAEPPRPTSSWSWPPLSSLVATGWLLGSVLFALVTAVRWWNCWRLLRGAAAANAELSACVDQLRQRLGVRRKVRVLVTGSPLGPAVVGLWRPTIILPAALLAGKTLGQLEPLLAHELAHVRRGDLWIGLLQTLAGGLWWFHPLVRLASRLATREAERCCDEEVIARLGCDPAAYARGLLDVLALRERLIPIPASPGVRPVDVTSQRLERIMKLGQGCHRRTPWWCWLLTILLAATALPGAAFVAGAKERAKPKPPDPKRYIRADVGGEGEDRAELSERTYDVAEILEMLRQESEGSGESAKLLLTQLVKSAATGPWVDDTSDAGRWVGLEGGTLRVRQSAAGHERIEQQLAVLREHGYAEVSVEVLILSGPTAVIAAKGIDWRMIGSREGTSPFAAEREEDMPRGAVRSVIEKHVPALVAQLDRKQADELLAAAQGHPKTNVIQAPKVTLFNGQSARIEDSVQRPFVVGVKPVAGDGKTALQPTVRVFSEGTTIRLRPVVQKDGPVQLDFALTRSSIKDVDTAEFPAGPGREPITVQVPEVATTRLSTTAHMKEEQALVLSLPKTAGSKKNAQPMCVLVKVKRLDEPRAAQPAPPSTQATRQTEEIKKLPHSPGRLFEWSMNGWRLRIWGDDWRIGSSEMKDGKGIVREMLVDGQATVEAIRQSENGEQLERIIAQARTAQFLWKGSTPGPHAPVTIALDGDVRMIRDDARIEAKQILLHFGTEEAPGGGSGPAGLRLELRDAKTVDLPSKRYLEDDVQYFPPSPERPATGLIDKVYPVADLVVPVPTGPIVVAEDSKTVNREGPQRTNPDFETLIERIQMVCFPNSWEGKGGQGTISPATNSLSLVIRQELVVHESIAKLLEQLRRLQDVQVILAIERLDVPPESSLADHVARNDLAALKPVVDDPRARAWLLTDADVQSLKKAASISQKLPRVTAFNGQGVEIRPPEGEQKLPVMAQIALQPVVAADYRSIRLQVSAGEAGEDGPRAPQRAAELLEVPQGQSVLVDLSQYAWQETNRGVPLLDKVPDTARLFRNESAEKPLQRAFFLVTPQSVFAGEENATRVLRAKR